VREEVCETALGRAGAERWRRDTAQTPTPTPTSPTARANASGRSPKRPSIQAAFEALGRREAGALVVAKLNRLSRSDQAGESWRSTARWTPPQSVVSGRPAQSLLA
jgi:hypothetical protein